MAKTPFEIRLELLQLANSMLSEQLFAERQRLEMDWSTQKEIAFTSAAPDATSLTLNIDDFPDLPTVDPDEVIELAKKLNDFVSNG